MDAVKFLDRGAGIIEGLAIPYGGPMAGRDLDGEAFDKDTVLGDLYGVGSPVIYSHGIDDTLGYTRIGSSKEITIRDDGVWLQSQLDTAGWYAELVAKLVDAGALGYSSGAIPNGIAKEKSGLIKAWPWFETSLTPKPANPFSVVSMKSKQPVIGLKAQAEILKKLGRLPDADEAQELAAPYMKQAEGPADKVESRLAALEQDRTARDTALKAQVRLLTVEHERILHGGIA